MEWQGAQPVPEFMRRVVYLKLFARASREPRSVALSSMTEWTDLEKELAQLGPPYVDEKRTGGIVYASCMLGGP